MYLQLVVAVIEEEDVLVEIEVGHSFYLPTY